MLLDKRTGRMIVGLVSGTFFLIGLILLLFKFINNDRLEPPRPDSIDTVVTGQLINWDQVDNLFPKQAKAQVVDVDTGLKFEVQRRGGYNHADVQPLTANDTAIMKKIYAGKWSWKRRAVVVQLANGQKIAASMNGMPHGQGAIAGNNFNGHFCLHFQGSRTHGSKKTDPAHQMMIWKSARVLDQQLQSLTPEETISVFFTAVDQHEWTITRQLLSSESDVDPLISKLKAIENIKATEIQNIDQDTFNVNINIVFQDTKRDYRQNIIVNTITSVTSRKIDGDRLILQLDKASWPVFEQMNSGFPDDEDWETEIGIE